MRIQIRRGWEPSISSLGDTDQRINRVWRGCLLSLDFTVLWWTFVSWPCPSTCLKRKHFLILNKNKPRRSFWTNGNQHPAVAKSN
ncbi:hypothetical protein PGT21_031662 [Puccinia graminis f. sp. tritici]|uniref:Uncharacterized protein n=1 Tax=Puccinia graminis f. sp. tritici TaxID=56615 RepID=A0A5B0P771_PUCGR|nr:hypothetical protein PGT21_031662 [Puccinia graminis f. sp. tritici]KAA1107934.1 hypothetical protein PGTUg99_013412 [Puccinia graminis f. sp. tritici]